MANLIVLIAGTVLTGKTTLADHIQENEKRIIEALDQPITVFPEYIEPIGRRRFYKALENFRQGKASLEDKDTIALFELECLINRIFRYEEGKDTSGIVFYDQGMISGAEMYCLNSYLTGILHKKGYDRYQTELYDALDKLDRTKPHTWLEQLIIYLEIEEKDLPVLEERSIKRAKEEGVEIIPPDHIKHLNERCEWFIDKKNDYKNLQKIYKEKYAVSVPQVLRINAANDFNQKPNYLSDTLNQIINKIKEMSV